MTRIFRTALALPVLAAVMAAGGCASTPDTNPVAGSAPPEPKVSRLGSKIPELRPYYGPENVRSIEAARDVEKMVAPPRSLRSN